MRLEPIAAPSTARRLVPPALAILATFLVAARLAMIAGGNPFAVFGLILTGAFGSKFAVLETLYSATPLILPGWPSRSPFAPNCGTSGLRRSFMPARFSPSFWGREHLGCPPI